MLAGLPRLGLTQRRLGDERPQAGVLGFLLEERELLLGDRELGSQALDALADVHEAPLEDRLAHGRQSTGQLALGQARTGPEWAP